MLIDLCLSLPSTRTQLRHVPRVTAVLNLVLTISVRVCKLLLYMFVSIHLFSVFEAKVLVRTCSQYPFRVLLSQQQNPRAAEHHQLGWPRDQVLADERPWEG